MFLYIGLHDLLRVQYVLAKNANINISESNELPDFEREIFLSLLVEDIKEENETFGTKSR